MNKRIVNHIFGLRTDCFARRDAEVGSPDDGSAKSRVFCPVSEERDGRIRGRIMLAHLLMRSSARRQGESEAFRIDRFRIISMYIINSREKQIFAEKS